MRTRLGLWADLIQVGQGVGAVMAAAGIAVAYLLALPPMLVIALALFLFGLGIVIVFGIRSFSRRGSDGPKPDAAAVPAAPNPSGGTRYVEDLTPILGPFWAATHRPVNIAAGGGGGGGSGGGAGGSAYINTAPTRTDDAIRLRLADPPDNGGLYPYLDRADLSITNETNGDVTGKVTVHWGEEIVQLAYVGSPAHPALAPREKLRIPFVARLREGGVALDEYGREFEVGRAYVMDPMPPVPSAWVGLTRVGANRPTWPLGLNRTQLRVEAHMDGLPVVSRRFDVYVPEDRARPMWVVSRGEQGDE